MSMINLFTNALQKISSVYVHRSIDYKNNVDLVSFTKTNRSIKFKFQVDGTDMYLVQIIVFPEEVVYMCSCPCYADNDECKHVAACLRHLIDNPSIYEKLDFNLTNQTTFGKNEDVYQQLILSYNEVKNENLLEHIDNHVQVSFQSLYRFMQTAINKISSTRNYDAGIQIIKHILADPPIVKIKEYADNSNIRSIFFNEWTSSFHRFINLCLMSKGQSGQVSILEEIVEIASKSYQPYITLNLLTIHMLHMCTAQQVSSIITTKLLEMSRTNDYIFHLFLHEVAIYHGQINRPGFKQQFGSGHGATYLPPYLLMFLETNLHNKQCLRYLVSFSDFDDQLHDKLLNICLKNNYDPEYQYIAYSWLLDYAINEKNLDNILKYATKVFSNNYITYQNLVSYFDLLLSLNTIVNKNEYRVALLTLITNSVLKARMAQYCKVFYIEFEILNDLILNQPQAFDKFISDYALNIENIPNLPLTEQFIAKYIASFVLRSNNLTFIKTEISKIINNHDLERLKVFTIISNAINSSNLAKNIQQEIKTEMYKNIQQTNTAKKIKIYFLD